MMQHSFLSPSRRRARASGAGLVTAIFLLVVLAGLATALVSVFTTQRQSSALDEQGARAYQAARSGIEWGLFRRAGGADCNGNFALPADSVLAGFAVSVTCTQVTSPVSSNPDIDLARWTIRATACTTPAATCVNAVRGPDYVERVIEVQL